MPRSPMLRLRPLAVFALASLIGLACARTPASRSAASAIAKERLASDDHEHVVVIEGQVPAPIGGVMWARLQPGGRRVSLLPADAAGVRTVAGPVLFAGPAGRFAAWKEDGILDVFQDGKRIPLGAYGQAAFVADGQVLAWDQDRWGLFSAGGELIRGAASQVALTRSGLLLERYGSLTRLVEPPGTARLTTTLTCRAFFPAAARMLCVDRVVDVNDGPVSMLHVVSLDDGQESVSIRAPAESAVYAFDAQGKRLAAASADIQVLDVAARRWTTLRRDPPRLGADRTAPKVAFSSDGKHVCVDNDGVVRIAPPPALGSGMAATCLFARRTEPRWFGVGVVTEQEWDAVLVTYPIDEGFEPIARDTSGAPELDTEALSLDGKTAVVMVRSRSTTDALPRTVELRALVLDPASGAVRRTVRVADYQLTFPREDPLRIALSQDGERLSVCAPGLFSGPRPCKAFDTVTGQEIPVARLGAETEKVSATSPPAWPVARASDALEAAGATRGAAQRILSFKDEGRYLSIDIGEGDAVQAHINLVDAGRPVAEDVVCSPDGSLLAIEAAGAVDLWSIQPLARQATMVKVGEHAWTALFPDGTFEPLGDTDVRASLACEREGALFPIASCASRRRPAGALRAVVDAAARGAPPRN